MFQSLFELETLNKQRSKELIRQAEQARLVAAIKLVQPSPFKQPHLRKVWSLRLLTKRVVESFGF